MCAAGDEPRQSFFGHVIVIDIEAPYRQVLGPSEGMQFLEIVVANQMCPESAVCGPQRIIDENCHELMLRRDTRQRAFAQGRGIR